jgi:hypothetical protein
MTAKRTRTSTIVEGVEELTMRRYSPAGVRGTVLLTFSVEQENPGTGATGTFSHYIGKFGRGFFSSSSLTYVFRP